VVGLLPKWIRCTNVGTKGEAVNSSGRGYNLSLDNKGCLRWKKQGLGPAAKTRHNNLKVWKEDGVGESMLRL